jgi:ATP/maltotriose-dependent transcriptional regulator MalT
MGAIGREERDPRTFWLTVLESLHRTDARSELVREMTAAPDLDGWMILHQLLEDLGCLADSLLLVIDDLHEWAAPRRCTSSTNAADPPKAEVSSHHIDR